MFLGDREPAPRDLEERHELFCGEGPRLTLVDHTAFFEETNHRLARLWTLHQLMVEQNVTEFFREGPPSLLFRRKQVAAVDGIVSTQAAVQFLEHAFQIVVAVILVMLVCLPFLRRPAAGAAGMH